MSTQLNTQLKSLLSKKQIEQLSDEWFEIRHNIITASECSSVLDCNKFLLKKDLLQKKCKPLKLNPDTKATIWGKKYEDIAFNIYSEMFNTKLYKLGLLIHDDLPWLGASPDGITENCKLLEIKCVYNRSLKKIPYYYWIQVQIQMEVTNTEECDLFQCKFLEFSNEKDLFNNYINSNKLPTKYNNSKLPTKYNNSKLPTGINKSLEYQDNISYWKLDNFRCDTIKRDRKWFEKSKNILFNFYNDMLYFKNCPSKLNRKRKLNNIIKKIKE